jgi:hypothetical protein
MSLIATLHLFRNGAYRLFLVLLIAAALTSVTIATNEAMHRSMDFQWSGAHLICEHQNPYRISLEGDPRRELILGQQPNYLPELFVMFIPLGLMQFSTAAIVWAMLNIALAILSVFLIGRIFNLKSDSILLLLLAFLSSTPFRVTVANGQQGLLVLLFLCLCSYCNNTGWRGVWLGFSYFKYSCAPVFAIYWLIARRYRELVLSLVPSLIGILVVKFLTHASFLELVFGPLRVAETTMKDHAGYADLMSLTETIRQWSGDWFVPLSKAPELIALLVGVSSAFFVYRKKNLPEHVRFGLIILFTLGLFKHLIYDFVLLLYPLGAVIQTHRSWSRYASFAIIAWFWFGSSLVNRLVHWPSVPMLAFNLLTLGLLVSLSIAANTTKASEFAQTKGMSDYQRLATATGQ